LRRWLRVVMVVALYYGILYGEAVVRQNVLKIPAFTPGGIYLPDAPMIVNYLLQNIIPITPLVIVAWFYKGGRRWVMLLSAVILFIAFLWLPWLTSFGVPISVDKAVSKAVENGYEVCGIYTATDKWNTFTYEATLSKSKRCLFIFLRPDPRFYYKLSINMTVEINLEKAKKSNSYTFYSVGRFVSLDQFYFDKPSYLPDFTTAAGNPIKIDNIIFNRVRTVPYDAVYWFTFNPEPGEVEVKVTLTTRLKAEMSTPWN